MGSDARLSRARLALAAIQAWRSGRYGDFAVLKAAAAGAPPTTSTQARLDRLPATVPVLDADVLASAPRGSLGARLRAFLARHHLAPLTPSADALARLRPQHGLSVRYAVLHDLFHVVLGFDASYAGELGVWRFVAMQDYSPRYRSAARAAGVIYPLLRPRQRAALVAAASRGDLLAAQVNAAGVCLVAEPLHEWLNEPIDAVRRRIGLR